MAKQTSGSPAPCYCRQTFEDVEKPDEEKIQEYIDIVEKEGIYGLEAENITKKEYETH